MTELDVNALNTEASALMKRGIALMQEGGPDQALEALRCFDQALALRRRVPDGQAAFQGYLLAACLLNRADALVRLGGEPRLDDALESYDEGIATLRALPLNDDARFPRRLAMAHHNRGLALQARGGQSGLAAAALAFADALGVLDDDRARGIPDLEYLRGVVWLNVANVEAARTEPGSDARARDAAGWSIAYVESLEGSDQEAADAGLRARHVLCRSCVSPLSGPAAPGESMPDEVHEATDAVDEGLALIRTWERRGVTRYRAVACDLFRFGARVYARYQPHFLAEFIDENTDPARSSAGYVESSEMRAATEEARAFLRPAD